MNVSNNTTPTFIPKQPEAIEPEVNQSTFTKKLPSDIILMISNFSKLESEVLAWRRVCKQTHKHVKEKFNALFAQKNLSYIAKIETIIDENKNIFIPRTVDFENKEESKFSIRRETPSGLFYECAQVGNIENLVEVKSVEDLLELAKNCSESLSTTLNLSNFTQITDQEFLELIVKFPDLQHIHIEGCKNLSDGALKEIGQRYPNLQSINIADCSSISQNALIQLVQECKHLQIINIAGQEIRDIVLKEISENCPGLKTINLSYCDNLTDLGISELCKCKELNLIVAFDHQCVFASMQQLKDYPHIKFIYEYTYV